MTRIFPTFCTHFAVGLLAGSAILAAQPTPPAADLFEIVGRPTVLRPRVGTAHESVTTRVPEAQQFYDQGLAFLHSYSWIEAGRSFNQALRLDPRLAMAQLGLSYALGE